MNLFLKQSNYINIVIFEGLLYHFTYSEKKENTVKKNSHVPILYIMVYEYFIQLEEFAIKKANYFRKIKNKKKRHTIRL